MKRLLLPIYLLLLGFAACYGSNQGYRNARRPTSITPSQGFLARKESYVQLCGTHDGFHNSVCRVALGQTMYDEAAINATLTIVNDRVGTVLDFYVITLLRMLYFDKETQSLPMDLKQRIEDTVLSFRYWFTDPPNIPDQMIFWTENHLVMYHTCELLAGQLFPDELFHVSGLTGMEHVNRVLPSLKQWLDRRGTLGFAEWHSNPYYQIDLAALVNLVDFASSAEISTKATMLVDLIGFDMANNYYKGLYATSMGRTEDVRRVTATPRRREGVTNSAYLILGLEDMLASGKTDIGSIAIATSRKYVPAPILEKIARATQNSHVHRERKSLQVDQGDRYNISYNPESIDDIMFWWSMSAPLSGPVVDATVTIIEQFNLDPMLVVNDAQFLDVLKAGANMAGVSLSEYCSTTAEYLVRGAALETASIYTYRTQHYQLSGLQDHQKGMSSLQEHVWQATLDSSTYVFTNSPSQLSEEFIGGWLPRGTFYKNVGVIQYDKDPGDSFLNAILATVGGVKDYLHAYFPRSQFDDWSQVEAEYGTYLFGKRGDGFVSLFSEARGAWQSDYEWRVPKQKNTFVLELGSADENGSFADFQQEILDSNLQVSALPNRGYNVSYESPSLGQVDVTWEGAMMVNGSVVDLGPYGRYDNTFCQQEFGSPVTEIHSNDDEMLILDFSAGERMYFGDDNVTSCDFGGVVGENACVVLEFLWACMFS